MWYAPPPHAHNTVAEAFVAPKNGLVPENLYGVVSEATVESSWLQEGIQVGWALGGLWWLQSRNCSRREWCGIEAAPRRYNLYLRGEECGIKLGVFAQKYGVPQLHIFKDTKRKK